MADIEAFLQKKAGPLPVWAWAAVGGGLISVVYLSKKGAAATNSTMSTDQSNIGQGLMPSPIIVTPGNIPASTSSANPPAPNSTGLRPGTSGTTVWNGHPYRWVVTSAGQGPTQAAQALGMGGAITDIVGRLVYFTPNPQSDGQGNTIWFTGLTDNGQPLPAWGTAPWPPPYTGPLPTAAGQLGGFGGGTSLSFIPGSGGGKVLRHATPHAHPQFLSVGMGGGGHAGLNAVSKKTGIPKIRLMALNPGHWQPRKRTPTAIHIR